MRELLKKEILLQWRQGFWMVYLVVSIIYVVILLNLPAENRMMVSLIMILSDTTMLGVIFVGALILLEKQQNVMQSLFITPLKPTQYIWAKTLSLSLIAITMSILIYLPSWTVSTYTILVFFTTLFTAGIFVMLGLAVASGVDTINQYFGNIMAVSLVIALPVVPYLLLDSNPAFLFLPYIASLDIMLGAVDPLPTWRIILDLLLLAVWGVVAFLFCRWRINKNLVYH
ncbi:MAG: ABC transporter permease [Bacteroidetes bacterium]|nr:ABC transporter permease [Bacteroidota bacterium]